MKRITLLIFILTACHSVHADETKWHLYEEITPQHEPIKVLDLKLKIIELSALRRWNFYNQTYDTILMGIENCRIKVEFNDKNTFIMHNGFKDNWGDDDGEFEEMICQGSWLSNLKKDIILSSKMINFQQEAIEIDKQYSNKKMVVNE